jgi:hypothetical protein
VVLLGRWRSLSIFAFALDRLSFPDSVFMEAESDSGGGICGLLFLLLLLQ